MNTSQKKNPEDVTKNIIIGLGIPVGFLGTAALGCKLIVPR